MSDIKPSDGNGDPPASEQLTREQVMAQRAEKKKLKEARKNKSAATGGDGGGGDGVAGEGKPKAEAQKSKKPQQQQKRQSEVPSEVNKGHQGKPQQKQGPKEKQSTTSKGSAASGAVSPADTTATSNKTTTAAKSKNTEAPKKRSSPEAETPTKAGKPEDKSSEESPKVTTTEKPKAVDYQSTIQSIFKGKQKTSKTATPTPVRQLHPLFHEFCIKLKNNVIRGTNLRCIALLNTIKEYVRTFEIPSGSTLKHGLSVNLKSNMDLLRRQCPFAIGMTNSAEFFYTHLHKIEEHNDTCRMKEEIMEEIDRYIEENIEKAVEAIVYYGLEKIKSEDVIMIYSITEAMLNLLEKAAEEGVTFELIVLHTPETMLDIPILLKRLEVPINKQSVRISTVNFSNAIYRMRHCSKLIIGGHGLFTTGGVMAQSGSGKLALLASHYNKPAIFLCETFKFCDRSPLDFFTLDEYVPEQSNNEDDLFEPKIKYDVTPANLVTVVITDIDMLPSISVPVVLRVQEGRTTKNQEESVSKLFGDSP